jgi:4-nitrophenyl phosphatase
VTGDLLDGPPKTFVFDLDGVVYVDEAGVPGARATLEALEGAGHQVLFATNNSSRAVDTVIESIARRTGFVAQPAAIITSGLAAAELLVDDDDICYVFGSDGLARTLSDRGITVTTDHEQATAVVVGLDRGLTYERLTGAVLAVRRGARFIATNDDATYPMPDGQYPGCGALVASVERATGVRPVVCGKPNPPMVRLVASRVQHPEVWVVGDRPETDLAMAKGAGWGTILVLTGVTHAADAVPDDLQPDFVLESIADLGTQMPARAMPRRG